MQEKLIRDDLLELQYYFDRLSKFMLESYGINEQVETFHSQLIQANEVLSEMLYEMDIFGNDSITGTLLNNLGKIFNCQRKFTIPVYDVNGNIDHYLNIDFTDDDVSFLIYIKTQIIKQNFDGTREQLRNLYSTYENGKLIEGILKDCKFVYFMPERNISAVCNIYWDGKREDLDDNLINLFENGYLTIESMGINYIRSIFTLTEIFKLIEENPTDLVSSNYLRYINGEAYILLETEPADGVYYELNETVLSSWPTWNANTYFRKDGNNIFVLTLREPHIWNDNNYLSRFYILNPQQSSAAFVANTYYKKVTGLGGVLG